MDEKLLHNLERQADPIAQQRVLAYLDELKNSDVGWQMCMATLTNGDTGDDQLKFFFFQVVEHYIKNHYSNANVGDQLKVREFLSRWIQLQCVQTGRSEAAFLRNKAAQIFSMVFVRDYPLRWPNFFLDLFETLSLGAQAVDNYVRVLKAIDSEVADNEILRTQQEVERNSVIKNSMREGSIESLVESWYQILKSYKSSQLDVVGQCLRVIGSYVSWIEIRLIANDQFIEVIVQLLGVPAVREAAVDCLHDIINKGMDPMDKLNLIETLVPVLQHAGLLEPLKDDETEFTCKLSRLVNGIGLNLIEAHNKLLKVGARDQLKLAQWAVEKKVPLMIAFLSNDYDDVSLAVLEFAKEYVHMLKSKPMLTEEQVSYTQTMILTVTHKMKYDESYCFEHEGEDEATFQEYRKMLKVLFDNLAALNKEMLIEFVNKFVMESLQSWQGTAFQDVELAITLMYFLGEAVPAAGGNHFTAGLEKVSTMQEMMRVLVTCEVSSHPHPAVMLQYLETVVRYEKFFVSEPNHVPNILLTFLDQRGMRNQSCKVRSRCAYLFSRFIKCLKSQVQAYTKDVLAPLQELLVLSSPECETHSQWVTQDDQLFLYETAGVLIISASFPPEQKSLLFQELLLPVLNNFRTVLETLMLESNKKRQERLAECLCHAMAVTSRTSKAFSNQQTMNVCGCVSVFLDALQVFLTCLQVPHESATLQSGVRQFLHRMVVCLEDELLPYIPQASEGLLKNSDIRSIQEYVPLIIQIITKFKKVVIPLLEQVLMPIVSAIFVSLATPIEENDEQARREKQLLQRNYFLLVSAIVSNNVTEVLDTFDNSFLEQVMMSIIRGAVDFPDPVAQKICFSILRKLVDLWGKKVESNGFNQFIYKNIVPACFMAPLKPTFDLSDAQTLLALAESALCMKSIFAVQGDAFIHFLHFEYLPTLQISPQHIEEYCQALKSNIKMFKNYIKVFFQQART